MPVIKEKDDTTYYLGKVAQEYESKRNYKKKWAMEDKIMRVVLDKYKPKELMDIPVGTGRFLKLYEKLGIKAIGIDVSPDMLKLAELKKTKAILREGDIFSETLSDFVVCVRLLNFFPHDKRVEILSKVPGKVAFTLRLDKKEKIEDLLNPCALVLLDEYRVEDSLKNHTRYSIYVAEKK